MNEEKCLRVINELSCNMLFKDVDKDLLKDIISKYKYIRKSYKKNEIIACEGDRCDSLGLIISGSVDIARILPSGKSIMLKKLNEKSVFGEAIIFSKKNEYPATITAAEDCIIINIKKEEILRLCSNEKQFLQNFMCMLSDKILMLNQKIKNISFNTVRHKVVNYIIEMREKQDNNNIKLKSTKEEIAEEIGIPRPSLSRELINLRKEELIEFDRNNIFIKDFNRLEELLFE